MEELLIIFGVLIASLGIGLCIGAIIKRGQKGD